MNTKEAIERIKIRFDKWALDDEDMKAIQTLVPELAESEDEKIRQELVVFISQFAPEHLKVKYMNWLEKQKYDRMKPIYDARESFESALEKAWNDYHNGYENVDKLEDDYVECAHAKGFREGYLFGIEKQKEQKSTIERLRDISTPADENWFEIQKKWEKEDEQKPTLNWRRIEEATTKRTDDGDCVTTEKMLVKGLIDDEDYRIIDKNVMVNRNLLCIPVRELCGKQKEYTSSTEETELNSIAFLEQLGYTCIPPKKDEYESYEDGNATGLKQKEQKPTEWSEEDKQNLEETLYFIREYQNSNRCKDEGDMQNSVTCENWLKSFRPLPHWKPSEEQMEALESAVKLYKDTHFEIHHEKIVSLYEQLKRLM
jgi:hypothetical protein